MKSIFLRQPKAIVISVFIGLGLIDGHAVYTWTLKQQVELYLYLSEWTITLHRSP